MVGTTIKEFQGDFRFLSNFEGPPVKLDGITYPRVENAYQAAKTLDLEQRRQFVSVTAAKAKQLGKQYITLRSDWNTIRLEIMSKLVRQKFLNLQYMQLLLATNEADLIEGNYWHDNFWGDCYCKKCVNIKGQNELGRLIKSIRDELWGFRNIF